MYSIRSFCCLVVLSILSEVQSHGYLYDPPSRSSMWRHGFDVPPNYDDNGLSCGGKEVQWGLHSGKCGICGDRYDGPRHNEAGGLYASGIISRNYIQGSIIPITVVLTAPHRGWFEFRLCPNNDVTKSATQECLNMHLLGLAEDPDSTRFNNVSAGGTWESASTYKLQYQLPASVTCHQCVLQWKYNTGKDWGCHDVTNICGVGLGPQEQFYGCADIAISPRDGSGFTTKSTTTTTTTTKSTPKTTPQGPSKTTRTTTTSTKSTTLKTKPTTLKKTTRERITVPTTKQMLATTTKTTLRLQCKGAGLFKGTVMDNRCMYMCRMGTCPDLFCTDACRELYAEFLQNNSQNTNGSSQNALVQ